MRKDGVSRERAKAKKGEQEKDIGVDRLAVGRTNAEDDCNDNVLEGRSKEER